MIVPKTNCPGLYQYFSGFSANIAVLICGMHYGWSAPSLPKLLDESSPIKINEDIGYWLIAAPIFGAIIGDLSNPLLVDTIGRHKTILLTAIPYLISWLMIYFSTDYPLMLAGRFIGGIPSGLSFCVVPMYLGEISEPRIRGLLGSSMSVSAIGGLLLIDILGSYCSIKMTALISCALPVALVVIFFFMPESPYFLIMKGKEEVAKQKLILLRGTEDVDKEIERIKKGIEDDLSRKNNPLDLIRIPSNRKAMFVLLTLKLCTECSGDSSINFYAQTILKEAGTNISEQVASIIFFAVELIVTGAAAGLVDKSGRRPLLIFSAAGAAVSLLIEGIYFYLKVCTDVDLSRFTVVPLVALISFVICSSTGLKVVPILMLGELLPQSVKASALCVTDMFAVIAVTSVTKFFQVTKDQIGMYFPFISFGVCCAITLVFVIFCVPETKGKTLEEIQDHFKGKTKTNAKSINFQNAEHSKQLDT